ncbi:metallophosphoesterase [Aquibacillus halophilus]|uniref:Metallophosphoesterase n=1 Tax=Aquibacillus halophilus TaxID=930132 RepID=A0A6A8DCN3_9BACI|nr:metallophosphoesterase [Aquibacillus halophilus]MRH43455.1 metallophosphoesterase [Aquibacillus halophilus]
MNKKRLALLTFIVVILAVSAKIYFDTNYFQINSVEVNSNKIPTDTDLLILQISDLHNKVFGKNNQKLISTVRELNADIIVITGDLIDRGTVEFDDVFHFIDNLKNINQDIYFVSGNHEWQNPRAEEFFNGLKNRHVTILDNKNIQITKNNVTLNLVGVADSSTNHEDVQQAFSGVSDDSYTVLLSHSPGIVENYHIPAELTLSGHTHGGQVRFPFIGALVAPDQGFLPKLDKGKYKLGQNQYLYIDSGLGTSILPIRFLNPSQLSLIRVINRDTTN